MSCDVVEALGRTVSGSEFTWCKAVPGGTGIAVLALLLSKPPHISRFQTALHKLQNAHPILNSTLRSNTTSFSFVPSPTPFVQVQSYDLSATSKLLLHDDSVSPFQQILEHELNRNTWHNPSPPSHSTSTPVLFASIYALPDGTWAAALRLHVAACDRTTAATILRELLVLTTKEKDCESWKKGESALAIEDLVPRGKAKKAMWSRGMDMLAYSFNSLKLTNLKFEDTKSTRCSRVVRLQLSQIDTERILAVSAV